MNCTYKILVWVGNKENAKKNCENKNIRGTYKITTRYLKVR